MTKPVWISNGTDRRLRALNRNPENLLVAYGYNYEKDGKIEFAYKYSTSFKTYGEYVDYLNTLNEKERENYLTHTKKDERDRLKIDIDLKVKPDSPKHLSFEKDVDELIKKAKEHFEIPNNVKHHISDRSRKISDDVFKCSYHIVFDAYWASASVQKTAWKDFVSKYPNFTDFIDYAVYTEMQPWNETKRKIITQSSQLDLIPSYVCGQHYKIEKQYTSFGTEKATTPNNTPRKNLKSIQSKIENKLVDTESLTEKQYEIIKKMLNELDDKYYTDRSLWMKVGWALKDKANTKKMLNLFVEFSKKWSNPEGHDIPHECKKIWSSKKNGEGKIGFGSLVDFHKKSKDRSNINFRDLIPQTSFDLMEDVESLGIEIKKFNNKNYITSKKDGKCVMDPEIFDFKDLVKKIVLVRSKTGSGKTNFLADVCDKFRSEGMEVLSVVSRQSMAYLHEDKLGLHNYQNPKWFRDDFELGFVYCLNSILKLNLEEDHQPYVLILDEFSSLITYILNDLEKFQDERIKILAKFYYCLSEAHTVICADGDMSSLSVKFLQALTNKPIKLYWNQTEYSKQAPVVEFENRETLIKELEECIMAGKPCFVGSDSIKKITKLFNEIKEKIKDSHPGLVEKMKLFTKADGDKREFIETEKWRDCFVFCSPTILYGLDCDYPARVFGFYSGGSTDALGISQQIARIRQPIDINIWFRCSSVSRKYFSIPDLEKDFNTFANTKIEKAYNDLRCGYEYQRDILMDLRFHVIDILKQKGHTISTNNTITEKEEKSVKFSDIVDKTLEKLKSICSNPDDIKKLDMTDAKLKGVYTERIECLGVCEALFDEFSDEEKQEYVELVLNDRVFKSFQMFKLYSESTVEELEIKLKNKDDFNIELERCDINKVILLKRLGKNLFVEDVFKLDILGEIREKNSSLEECVVIEEIPEIKRVFKLRNHKDLKTGLDFKKQLSDLADSMFPRLFENTKVKINKIDYRCKIPKLENVRMWSKFLM